MVYFGLKKLQSLYHLCTIVLSLLVPTLDTLNLSFLPAQWPGGNSKFLGRSNATHLQLGAEVASPVSWTRARRTRWYFRKGAPLFPLTVL